MSSMVGCGIINGTSDNTLAPKANVSIEQAAILIYRLYGQSILKDITPLAEAFVSDQKAIITKLQGAYTSTPSTFSDSRIDSIQMAEVFQENGTTYILYSLKYSVKADNPEAVIVFEDTLKDGWLVINAVTTYVVQMDGGKLIIPILLGVVINCFFSAQCPNERGDTYESQIHPRKRAHL